MATVQVLSDEEHARQTRISTAISKQRDSWGRQVNLIFKTRDAANFKRRHKTIDRTSTLMDLQTQFTPREQDTITSFYQTSLCDKTRRNLNTMTQKRISQVSKVERHRFNLEERCVDFRAELRDNNFVYQEHTANARNKLWVTKPRT